MPLFIEWHLLTNDTLTYSEKRMTKKNELSVPANFDGKTTVAARSENVGQGSAAVTANDMAIPRLKLLQMINPEVQPGGPEQVQGAQAGMIMNSVNNELFTSVFLINLNFTRKTVVHVIEQYLPIVRVYFFIFKLNFYGKFSIFFSFF